LIAFKAFFSTLPKSPPMSAAKYHLMAVGGVRNWCDARLIKSDWTVPRVSFLDFF
jgi:hypothetical protein